MNDDDPAHSPGPAEDAQRQIEHILRTVAALNPDDDLDLIRRAYEIAEQVHRHQRRKGADIPYIVHPLSVASLCAEHHMDAASVAAAILHDCIEDSDGSVEVSKDTLATQFGPEVAVIVDGLTKLQRHEVNPDDDPKLATLVKLLRTAAATDVRIIVIKLFDRADNIRTLDIFQPGKQQRIAAETRDFYIPIATRLGFYKQARLMEDHVMRVLHPDAYTAISTWLRTSGKRLEAELRKVGEEIRHQLSGLGIETEVTVYPKGIHTIFEASGKVVPARERLDDSCNFNLRLVVEDVDSCFRALAVVHRRLAHQRGTVRDFIHSPKVNGYQSLHTICRGPTLPRTQVLIRTRQMDEDGHIGVIAQIRSGRLQDRRWLTELLDSLQGESGEVLGLTSQLAFAEIEVFTPNGRAIRLPEGASALDFAFAIHTELGESAFRAVIDGEERPVRTVLRSNQRVEIIRSTTVVPSYQHLEWVRTNRARIAIRRVIRRSEQAAFAAAVQSLSRYCRRHLRWELRPGSPTMARVLAALNLKDESDLGREITAGRLNYQFVFAAAASWMPARALDAVIERMEKAHSLSRPAPGEGAGDESRRGWVRERLHEQVAEGVPEEQPVSLPELRHPLQQALAACCRPEYGDELVAVTAPIKGATLHRWSCREIRTLVQEDSPRVTPAAWRNPPRRHITDLLVRGRDRRGLLAAIADILLRLRLDIQSVHLTARPDGSAEGRIRLDLQETMPPEQIVARLQAVDGITHVRLDQTAANAPAVANAPPEDS